MMGKSQKFFKLVTLMCYLNWNNHEKNLRCDHFTIESGSDEGSELAAGLVR